MFSLDNPHVFLIKHFSLAESYKNFISSQQKLVFLCWFKDGTLSLDTEFLEAFKKHKVAFIFYLKNMLIWTAFK